MEKIVEWNLNIKTVSEANCSEHWSRKHKRHKSQKKSIRIQFIYLKPNIFLPCHVKLIRISPRLLDQDDNLPCAFKWIKDEIAAHLTGNFVPGRADEDYRISWSYSQEKGSPQSIRIEFYKKSVD
jgi:hypothetical protein